VDKAENRLFIGPFELDAANGKPTGRKLSHGQQVLALDETSNTYWAIGVEKTNEVETNVLVLLYRGSLQELKSKSLNQVSGIGESFALDLTQRRLYVGKMTMAELEIWAIGEPASPASTDSSAQPADIGNTYWVTNPTSGARLYVEVIFPREEAEKYPVLVLVPGGLGDSSFFLPAKARTFSEAGFAVIVFDPDGRGRSGGEEDFNGYIHQDGLAAVIRFSATLPKIDSDKIGLVTYSYGITIGSGALARYPDLPVKFLIDWEGPAHRRFTTGNCQENFGGISWPSCTDDVFWLQREAVNFISEIRVPYQRIQSAKDHAQPVVAHAIEMVNAAVEGGVPWVRLNDEPPNQKYDPNTPPRMLPESQDPLLEQYIVRYAQELLAK
jgi:dipeptidyl aminopeptidase/acylaminoacyl peptidase